MPTLTTITLTISFAVIKHMLADWAGDGVKSQIGQDLLDLCRDRINDWAGSKSERNQIEQMGERIVATMTPLWESESRNLPENSKESIALAVANTLAHSKIDAESIIQHRLDAERLAKSLADEQKTETVGFSRNESALYQQMLIESCRQIIYVANHLNGYVPLMDRLMLLTLEQLLQNTERLIAGPAEEAREYEAAYREQLPNQLNKFELIGINYAHDVVTRQKLQKAYVNLRLERSDGREGTDLFDPNEIDERTKGSALPHKARTVAKVNGPIQEILALFSRLVIRGAPGSGKSTMLRWLAMSATKHELSKGYPAIASWDDAIPFYLRLRSFKNGEIPNPMEWAELNVPKLALNSPEGWMHKLLKDGRALVLIDGVDEVPGKQRATLLENLENLLQTYPLARYIITSRPAAIKDWPEWIDWTRKYGFSTVGLQEMELEQSFTFIDQWHDALAESLEKADDKEKVAALKQPIKQLLRQRLPLRRLARNPLLCTMICALHRERPHNMPQNRVKLYQDCVELLLYKRDTERGINLNDYPELTYTHEEVVLRDYAHHLMRNGESEESFEEVDGYFDQLLQSMHMPGWTGALLRDYFLQRTGLLIEPADGKIAFAHRTFQEYLAAREIVKKNDISFLLDKARDDQWHETIMLAVSIPEITEKQSERLFKGLLKKAEELTTLRLRHELYLLAIACMESPLYLSKELRQQIVDKAATFVPPKNSEEVARIAKAGDPMVEFLRYNPHFSFGQMARCVDALVAIGSERALTAIVIYASSSFFNKGSAWKLNRAVAAGLFNFDPPQYTKRVFEDTLITNLSFTKMNDLGLMALQSLMHLESLEFQGGKITDAGLSYLQGLTNLQSLDITSRLVTNTGLAHLHRLTKLQSLDLNINQLTDDGLVHLQALKELQTLSISSAKISEKGLTNLNLLTKLQKLSLNFMELSDNALETLKVLTELISLQLWYVPIGNDGLVNLLSLPKLKELSISSKRISTLGLIHLRSLTELESLSLVDMFVGDEGITYIQSLAKLRSLNLIDTDVSDIGLTRLQPLTELQELYLRDTLVSDAGLTGIRGFNKLRMLDLSGTKVSGIGLAHLNGLDLQYLNISHTHIDDAGIAYLQESNSLQVLNLGDTKLGNQGLIHLQRFSKLISLDLSNTQVSDAGLAYLAGLHSLQSLDLRNTLVKDTSALEHLLGLDIEM